MNHAYRFHKYLLLPLTVILMFGVLGSDCKKSSTGPDTKPDTMTGNDGKVYQTVTIGNQVWMAENLRETKYRNGDAIPNVTDNTEWSGLSTGARCAYNNSETTADTYGYLYNWYAVDDSRNLAPSGWRVPTDADWTTLTNYLGSNAGVKMKEAGTSHWNSPNTGATNESGFTALPGGYRCSDGDFINLGYSASFWSSTEGGISLVWARALYFDHSEVSRYSSSEQFGFSVRLVRE